MVRVVVVSPYELYRECFTMLLAHEEEIRVGGVAATSHDAVAVATRERPDAIVIVVAGEDSSPAVAELAAHAPVLVVGCRDEEDASRALAAGARGVVGMMHGRRHLVEATHAVARGEEYTRGWNAAGGDADGDGEGGVRAYVDPLASLTARERQVFSRLIEGESNVEIGERLGISAKTVDSHRTHVMRKIGVHSIVQLVRFAVRHQLLSREMAPDSTLRA